MSGPQSYFDKVRATVSGAPPNGDSPGSSGPRLPGWIGALAGVVLGLGLGLLIGWVIWPVEWTNVLPPDLSEAAKADYVSSVADAYVAARNQQAADTAQTRMRYFGSPEEIAAAIEAAQAWYGANGIRDAGVRINNMNELASVLQLDLPPAPDIGATPSPATAAEAAPQPEVDITPVSDLAEPAPAEWGWARWLAIMLTGLLLIAGGLHVLRRMVFGHPEATSSPRTSSAETVGGKAWDADEQAAAGTPAGVPDGFDEEADDEIASAATSRVAYEDGTRQMDEYTSRRAGVASAPPAESYGFDEESMDVAGAVAAPVSLEPEDAYPRAGDEPSRDVVGAVAADDLAAMDQDGIRDDDGFGDDGFGDDDFEEDDFEDVDFEDDGFEDDGFEDDGFEDESAAVAPVAAATAVATAAAAARPVGRVLGEYTVHFVHGDPDYESSFNILDAEGGSYIGECGMGINMKNGILQNNPENVVALDVWLFDKTDDRKLETKTVVLISPQVIDRDLGRIFGADRESFDLRQPEPNMQFRLEGGHLILDCVVKDVSFFDANSGDDTGDGVFRTLEIDMIVYRRR